MRRRWRSMIGSGLVLRDGAGVESMHTVTLSYCIKRLTITFCSASLSRSAAVDPFDDVVVSMFLGFRAI